MYDEDDNTDDDDDCEFGSGNDNNDDYVEDDDLKSLPQFGPLTSPVSPYSHIECLILSIHKMLSLLLRVIPGLSLFVQPINKLSCLLVQWPYYTLSSLDGIKQTFLFLLCISLRC